MMIWKKVDLTAISGSVNMNRFIYIHYIETIKQDRETIMKEIKKRRQVNVFKRRI